MTVHRIRENVKEGYEERRSESKISGRRVKGVEGVKGGDWGGIKGSRQGGGRFSGGEESATAMMVGLCFQCWLRGVGGINGDGVESKVPRRRQLGRGTSKYRSGSPISLLCSCCKQSLRRKKKGGWIRGCVLRAGVVLGPYKKGNGSQAVFALGSVPRTLAPWRGRGDLRFLPSP